MIQIQVGKKYEVAEPKMAEHLGFLRYVKILKEDNGVFFGDNEYLYWPDGRIVFEAPFGATETIHLAKEVEE